MNAHPFHDGKNNLDGTGNQKVSDSLFEEQLRLFFRFQPIALSANFAGALFLAAILRESVPAVLLVTWMSAFVGLLATRYLLAKNFHRENLSAANLRGWAVKAYGGVVATGTLWGIGATFMRYQLTPNQEIAIPLLI
ncbi:MAG: hypothetical protein HQK85_10475, partial [Nitrospinae bacterium]|nr:hypothetical protein [Nitrospinota bacterium]